MNTSQEIKVFGDDAKAISENQMFFATVDSVEGHKRVILKRAYEIPSGMSSNLSDHIGKQLIEMAYVEHTIDSKTKQQHLKLTPVGREVLNKLFQLYDTEVSIKGMSN